MKKALLVLSTSGTPDKVIAYAVDRAKKDGLGLIALYILETGLATSVFDTFSDIGFIGDRPSEELSEAIMKEYRQRGYEELGRVQVKAMEEAVDYDPVMEQGDFVEKTLDVIRDRDVSVAVLVQRKKKDLFKYFKRSHADEVREKAACEVVVFNESSPL
ncbi:MAG: universal stress protein [Deltaproteobacteria bacterium]|nr:universal stress protein [Deltaproteobacteria bacterium]